MSTVGDPGHQRCIDLGRVSLKPSVEGAPGDSQGLMGSFARAPLSNQFAKDRLIALLFKNVGRPGSGGRGRRGKGRTRQNGLGAEDRSSDELVPEFPDVSRPCVVGESCEQIGCQSDGFGE